MKKKASPTLSRRRVFAGAGTVGALAAAAAVLPRVLPDAEATPEVTGADAADGRYQVTQHVLRYYQTAKV